MAREETTALFLSPCEPLSESTHPPRPSEPSAKLPRAAPGRDALALPHGFLYGWWLLLQQSWDLLALMLQHEANVVSTECLEPWGDVEAVSDVSQTVILVAKVWSLMFFHGWLVSNRDVDAKGVVLSEFLHPRLVLRESKLAFDVLPFSVPFPGGSSLIYP